MGIYLKKGMNFMFTLLVVILSLSTEYFLPALIIVWFGSLFQAFDFEWSYVFWVWIGLTVFAILFKREKKE